MQDSATITFAIPFYKNCEYLRRALNSVLAQQRSDWVCLVADDHGPEPEAKALVEGFSDARISYVRFDQNAGLAGNWNRCLQLAKTPLVTLLHSDDELLPNYANIMLDAVTRHPAAAAFFCDALIIDTQSQETFSVPDYVKKWIKPKSKGDLILAGDHGLSALLKGNFIMCPTLCFHIAQLASKQFDPRWKMVLDLAFIANQLFADRKIIGVQDVAYAYRRHESNQTSLLTASRERFHEEMGLYHELSVQAGVMDWSMSHRVAAQKNIIKLHLGYSTLKNMLQGRPLEAGKDLKTLYQLYRTKPRLSH
jgi:glycosyltransferase involved in cell wall biosynthesis